LIDSHRRQCQTCAAELAHFQQFLDMLADPSIPNDDQ
jgi:hypothetical protein